MRGYNDTYHNGKCSTPPAFHLLAGFPTSSILLLQTRMPHGVNNPGRDTITTLTLETQELEEIITEQKC